MPLISVIMPVYNAEKFLRKSLQSILDQSISDFEVIVINDGSTDGSLSIASEIAEVDQRLRVISRENRGIVHSLNEGIELTDSAFIARMDSDDVAYQDRLSKQITVMRDRPECVLNGTQTRLIDAFDRNIVCFSEPTDHRGIDDRNLQGQTLPCHPTVMMRRAALDKVGYYRKEFELAEDLDLFLRLAEVGKIAIVPKVLLDFRLHLDSISNKKKIDQHQMMRKAAEEAARRRNIVCPFSDKGDLTIETTLDTMLRWGWWSQLDGNFDTALHYAFKCIQNNPLDVRCWRLLVSSLRKR